jgi:hypothetical protein
MRVLSVTLALAFGALASAQDKKTVDNPAFASWSKFKAGAAVTLKMTNDAGGTKSSTTMTTKLVEVKADEVTVEVTTETEVMGMKFAAPAMKQTHKKSIEIPANTKVPEATGKPEGTTEEGTETVKVGATEVKTKWYKFKTKTPAGDFEGQVWTSDDVPGMVVKMVSKGDKFSSTMELTEVKK